MTFPLNKHGSARDLPADPQACDPHVFIYDASLQHAQARERSEWEKLKCCRRAREDAKRAEDQAEFAWRAAVRDVRRLELEQEKED